jgi:hypothetical protein
MRVEEASADWFSRGEVRIPPGLVLSFQRFAWPGNGVVEHAPSSLGVLPVGIGAAREILLPLAHEECFWIGLGVSQGVPRIALALAVELRNGKVLDAISGESWNADKPSTVAVEETRRIEGIRRRDGRIRVLARETRNRPDFNCVCLRFRVAAPVGAHEIVETRNSEACVVPLRLVDYGTFAAETGLTPPAPLDPDAGYKGWLLP